PTDLLARRGLDDHKLSGRQDRIDHEFPVRRETHPIWPPADLNFLGELLGGGIHDVDRPFGVQPRPDLLSVRGQIDGLRLAAHRYLKHPRTGRRCRAELKCRNVIRTDVRRIESLFIACSDDHVRTVLAGTHYPVDLVFRRVVTRDGTVRLRRKIYPPSD